MEILSGRAAPVQDGRISTGNSGFHRVKSRKIRQTDPEIIRNSTEFVLEVPSTFQSLIEQDGFAAYDPIFFSAIEADSLLRDLLSTVPWSQESIKVFGRSVPQPRLTCWMGDPGSSYRYSGLQMVPKSWSHAVSLIKYKIEKALNVSFNGALLNFYRDGGDSMGWHRDNEKELGSEPVIASASFGAQRSFDFRRYKSRDEKLRLQLDHGSLLLMSGTLQKHWEHRLPKISKASRSQVGPRINITFRRIINT